MGQSIYNSHKRVTWLSFWTVSGPLKGQPQTTTNYYNHGFAAGAWVATQIDQYRSLGVGLKPDWVIFDPEGYPTTIPVWTLRADRPTPRSLCTPPTGVRC